MNVGPRASGEHKTEVTNRRKTTYNIGISACDADVLKLIEAGRT